MNIVSLVSGKYPSQWKRGVIKPLYKHKGDRSNPAFYRPVVLLPCVSEVFEQSEKFLDLGTVTRPPSSIYARVNCFVMRDWCTRVQGHPRNLFRRPWNFGLSSLKHHT